MTKLPILLTASPSAALVLTAAAFRNSGRLVEDISQFRRRFSTKRVSTITSTRAGAMRFARRSEHRGQPVPSSRTPRPGNREGGGCGRPRPSSEGTRTADGPAALRVALHERRGQ
jgi:hypothetical protein